ncbi:MAG: hypothetical protein KA175_11865 [Flavobacteriales bacterium]|nr:hypothetical protein [Flavobacteriales bacterium]MBP6698308.1 hypothetical protein [Flavobacteriales bacterium]
MNTTPWRFLLAIICALPLSSTAQNDSIRAKQHSIYIGLLGNGLLYSFAYDLSWPVGRSRMSAGLGAGYLPDPGPKEEDAPAVSKFTLPVQWNWYHGKKGRFEHGLGLTYARGLSANADSHSDALWAAIKPIAYRSQRPQGGFFFRVQAYLMIKFAELNPEWEPYREGGDLPGFVVRPFIGIDLGYTFPTKR